MHCVSTGAATFHGMLTRALALKGLLVLLGTAAALAIVSIFLQMDLGWRLSGVSAVLGVAIALAIPVVPTAAGTRLTPFGAVYLGFLAFGAICATVSILTDGESPWIDLVGLWTLLGVPLLGATAPALASRANTDRALDLAERVSIGGAALVAAAALALTIPDRRFAPAWIDGLWSGIEYGFVMLGSVVPAAACATGLRRPSKARFAALPPATRVDRAVGAIGFLAALATLLASLAALAVPAVLAQDGGAVMPESVQALWPFAATTAPVAVAAGAWCYLGLTVVPGPFRFLRHLSAAALLATGTVLAAGYWLELSHLATFQPPFLSELLGRLTFAFAVLAGTSLLAAIVFMRIHRARPFAGERIARVDWRCPRCGRREIIALGGHTCGECGLSAEIRVRDDRCPACAYDLRGIPVDAPRCPECGHERQRPAPASLA